MISFFVASMRPSMLSDMIQSLYETASGYLAEIVVSTEDLDVANVAMRMGAHTISYREYNRGGLQAWNDALTLCQGDILIPTGDDQVFHPRWLEYALESHRERLGGYGVVGMNDLAYDGNTQVATMWLFDRKYCEDVMGGIFAPPVYKYYCVDLEWNEKAKSLGRFYWDERSKVEHLHSAHGKRPVDAVDLSKNADWMETDNKVFAERKAQSFPVTWNPII